MYSLLAVFLFIPYNDINFNRSAEGSATGIFFVLCRRLNHWLANKKTDTERQ